MLALIIIARVIVLAANTNGGRSTAGTAVIVALICLGIAAPLAVLVWNQLRGVHIYAGGIKSVGANSAIFVTWREIASFDTGPYLLGTIAVFVVYTDGKRVALGDTTRWPYQRAALERVRDELESCRTQYKDQQMTTSH